MNFVYDGTDYVEYDHICCNILGGIVSNISLVVVEGNFGAIGAED